MRHALTAFLATCLLLGIAPVRGEGPAAPITLSIRVVAGEWGRAAPADIEAVVRSAAAEFLAHVADRPPLAIVVVAAATHPRVLYEKSARGEYVVQLSARDRRWSQFAYQFAHELCHVIANFDRRMSTGGAPLTQHQWFEETLCEAAAVFTLRRMAVAWSATPPFAHWRDYAPWLREYADLMLAAEHRRGAREAAVAGWFAAHSEKLARDPYARELNELCATALMPLFEAAPGEWNAVRYLNRDGAPAAATFDDYLARWHAAAPERHRPFVERLASAFGLVLPPRAEAALARTASMPRP
jgi:hypothetical protein